MKTFFDVIDSEEKAYWLGFIYADGNVSKNGYTLTIGLQATDSSHLMKLADIFKRPVHFYTQKAHPSVPRERQTVFLRVCSKHVVAQLNRHGIYPAKSRSDDFSVVKQIIWYCVNN